MDGQTRRDSSGSVVRDVVTAKRVCWEICWQMGFELLE